mgnify:FL=1
MLPKWKQRKSILALLFWILSLYDVNEREVWSMAFLIMAKKLALELNVSIDELISDEDVNDIQVNYEIWKSERTKNKKHLQTLQKKILDFIQIVGAVFLAMTILLRVQLDMRVPAWCTIIYFIIVAVAFLCNFIVSKKLREM